MANSGQIRGGIQTLLQDNLAPYLQNTLFDIMPMMWFFFNRDGDKTSTLGLGRPKVKGENGGIFISGIDTAKARKAQILSGLTYMPIVQTAKPDIKDGKTMAVLDNAPVRRNWENTSTASMFNRPRAKFCRRLEPYKVSNEQIRITRNSASASAVVSLFEAETKSVSAVHSEWWNQRFWGTGLMDDGTTANTGAPSSEDADAWDNLYSMQKALDTTSTYCGVDRTLAANSYWKGADFSGYGTVFDVEAIVNYANYDLGLSKKGYSIDLLMVDGTNFKKAKSEYKSKGHKLIHQGDDIPAFGRFGIKKELIQVDNTFVCYDAQCPTGHVAGLNLATWTIAMPGDANWTISKPFNQRQIEGGDDAMAGDIETKVMQVCEAPSMNFYQTGIIN